MNKTGIIMTNYVYYHNPRCSKSRPGLALLEQNGIDIDIKEYIKVPFIEKEVEGLFNALGLNCANDMIRKKEKEYIEAGLNDESSNSQVISAIVKYPKLLERPILTNGINAAIGRPLDNFQELITG
jgi:arsenate reductase